MQTITLNVAGNRTHSFVQNAKAEIAAKVHLAPGGYVQFTGTVEAQAQSRRDLLVHSLLAARSLL